MRIKDFKPKVQRDFKAIDSANILRIRDASVDMAYHLERIADTLDKIISYFKNSGR